MSSYLHVKLGPVQSFVAQARRTRDFWAGSFLLSWLSAVAVETVRRRGGSLEIPSLADGGPEAEFLKWLRGEASGDRGPRNGVTPNRFLARFETDDPASLMAEAVQPALQRAWKALADLVWEEDLAEFGKAHPDTVRVWQTQTEWDAFWELTWCVSDRADEVDLLDRRANWRSHLPPEQPGVKCMLMDGWQELSGVERPGKAGNPFWRDLAQRNDDYDLDEEEPLCALAFIKRRFARHFPALPATEMPGGWTLHGWKLPTSVPSHAYLAAAPWLASVIESSENSDGAIEELAEAALSLTDDRREEADSNIKCLKDAASRRRAASTLIQLDAKVFFPSELENARSFTDVDDRDRKVQAMREALSTLKAERPRSPFFAFLLADGDRLGAALRYPDQREGIAKSLSRFSKEAERAVYDHDGFLIYAGGDDVLAMLTLEGALPCALQLRRLYREAFEEQFQSDKTLSVAVSFCHMHTPLTRVLLDLHDLLDRVAKDECGRDALAVRVWKPGGLAVEWAQPWQIALTRGGEIELAQLAERVRAQDDDSAQFSGKFFYRIRERLDLLNPRETGEDHPLTDAQAVDLMTAEYLHSAAGQRDGKSIGVEQARAIVAPLLAQCKGRRREQDIPNPDVWPSRDNRYEADGALLVRFLARRGAIR